MQMKAVTVVSGGMDSAVLAYNLAKHYDQTFLSFNYGQRHKKELKYAKAMADKFGCPHQIIDLTSLNRFLTTSSLTAGVDVPDGHYSEDSMRLTVVPNRNAIMLSIAFSVASSMGAAIVATGVHAGDHAQYPDCRPKFATKFQEMEAASLEGFNTPSLYTPFIELTKTDIAKIGGMLGVPFEETWSCYKGGEVHCGRCGTDVERIEALHNAGVEDKTVYADPDYWKQAVKEYAEKTKA